MPGWLIVLCGVCLAIPLARLARTDAGWPGWMACPRVPPRAASWGVPTVVIHYTKVRTSRFLEAGVRPPYAQSTGAGTGVVLRGGQAYAIH